MNTPQSREGNIIRYLVYFAVFIFTALVDDLAIKSSSISILEHHPVRDRGFDVHLVLHLPLQP